MSDANPPLDDAPAPMRASQVGGTVVVSVTSPPLPEVLSGSEREVVRKILEGRSNPEIAALRGTSSKTVANQIQAVYRKLGVRSRDELVAQVFGVAARDR